MSPHAASLDHQYITRSSANTGTETAGGRNGTAPFFPQLRDDVQLHPAVHQIDGSPSWVLHDPVANRFVQIGWLEFEILNRWSLGNAESIVNAVNQQTALHIDPEDVMVVGQFLTRLQMLQIESPQTIKSRVEALRKERGKIFKKLLAHYLFFRIPLVHPDRFLEKTLWMAKPFFSPFFHGALVAGTLLSLFLVMRQWDVFIHSSIQLLTWNALFSYFAALFVAKGFHELGHAYCCKWHGLHVPVIGVAFLVFVPFLYTDTGESWKLTSRKKRFAIAAAGMFAEFILAVGSTLAWVILPPGPLRDAAFFLATTSWVMTLVININPFMRWDGYYLLSDLTGIKNLQPRSNELAKWRVREWIFGFNDPPPEEHPVFTHRFMIAFAFCVWIYRLVVFFGIALLVYHFFVKAAGIFLAIIELAWFIWLPVQRELKVWYDKRKEMSWNRQSCISCLLLGFLLLMLIVPWRGYVLLPAVIRPTVFTEFFPPMPGRIEQVYVDENQTVGKGTPLFSILSPELEYDISQAVATIRSAEAILQRSSNDSFREQRDVAIEQYFKAKQHYEGLVKRKAQLLITAPFDGVMVRVPNSIKPGLWVGEGTDLGMLADISSSTVNAYADTHEIKRLKTGTQGKFYVEHALDAPLPVTVAQLSTVNIDALPDKMLASAHGGPVATTEREKGKLRPIESIFWVQLTTEGGGGLADGMKKGFVRLDIEPESYLVKVFRNGYSLLIRESGF